MLRAPTCSTSRISADQFDLLDRHHFRHDGQAGLLAGEGEQFQPLFRQSLEGIGIGSRLERSAAKSGRAGFLHGVGNFQELVLALDAARPGNHAHLLAAGGRPVLLAQGKRGQPTAPF